MIWKKAQLKDIGNIVTGSTPSKSKPEYFDGNIPFISPAELGKSIYVNSAKQSLSQKGGEVSRLLPKNAVMVCCIGSLGKTAISSATVATNQQINSIIVDEAIADPLYVYFFCLTLKPVLENMAPATTVAIVNKTRFSELEIPLPPLTVQKQIAAILEKADTLRGQCQQMEQELNTLAQSVFLDMFGDYRKANKAEFLPLGDCANVCSGVTKGQKFNGKPTVIAPYMRVANVQDGYLDLKEIKEIEAKVTDFDKYLLKPGDILMTEGGDHDKLGRGAVWEGQIEGCIHQNHVFRVRLSSSYLPKYFEYLLQSQYAKQYFLKCAKKTTNLASINITQLKSLPMPNLSLIHI